MSQYQVLVLVGSLRRESLTRRVAHAMMSVAPPSLVFRELDLAPLPMYNEDLEANPPESWLQLRRDVRACDGLFFLTPEYNRSVPGVLKNAIDVGSRPSGQWAWNGKPAGVASVTPFGMGGFGANHHLRQALVYVNVPAMAQPEAYISRARELFDADGALRDETARTFFTKYMTALAEWIATLAPGR